MEKIELHKNRSGLSYSSAHLIQITSGSSSLTDSSGNRTVSAPTLMLVPPLRQERIDLRGQNQVLSCPTGFFLQALNSMESSMHIPNTSVYASAISKEDSLFTSELIKKAETILNSAYGAYNEAEANILHILCLCILIIRRNTAEGLDFKPVWTISDALIYIDRNFSRQFTLEFFTNRCALNSSSFSRLFKQSTDSSLFEYINQVRIRQACYLLKRSRSSILEIALSLGYNNISFFNRYFRRITGCSPSEYRRRNSE
ncbi:helix-turn-helix domain-containing protein [Spirochaeta dissipatitropha]